MNPLVIDWDKVEEQKIHHRANPIDFFIEVLGVPLENIWDMMEVMVEMVRDNQKTVIKAGHSVSKTYTLARIVLWFLYCWSPSTVITTAPTHTQVEELLWREIHVAHANAKIPLGGHLTKVKLDLQKKKLKKGEKAKIWFAFGFSTKPDQGQEYATKMQGFHNEHMLVIFDEADGILPAIWNALDALLTNPRVKFVGVGNPMKPTGNFPDSFKDPSFAKLTISVKDTPNYIEGREVITGLSGRQYEESQRIKWGVDSSMYKSRVLGEIPDSDPESIVPVSWYEAAEAAKIVDVSGIVKKFVVVDVADGGNDDTVVKGFHNKVQVKEWRYPGKRADEIDSSVIRNCREIGGNAIVYDHDGCGRILGGLLTGTLGEFKKEQKGSIKIVPFIGSDDPYDPDFTNRRAEGHFAMHIDFRDRNLSVFPGNELAKRDITTVRWSTTRSGNRHGKIDVEAKVDLKKRLGGDSPDDGDNIMMMSACYDEIPAIEKHDMYVVKRGRRSKGWKTA